nr:uncharacterized protein LOC109169324 [Ipomoea trifida]
MANKSPCLDECFCVDTIDSCVGETLSESNWVSNYPLQDDMGDTNEEEHMEEDTSGDDEPLEAYDPLTPPPMYEALSLGDHLASQKENIAPKVELKPLPSELRAKLIPNSHRGNVKRDLVFLTYCIKEQRTIDIGRLISRSISEITQAEAKSRCYLGHPSLITELCRLAGVPIIENQEVWLPPQLYLSQHHIQTRYSQGSVPVPDPEDAENEDQANEEAMEEPAPAAHAPDQSLLSTTWSNSLPDRRNL